MLTCNVMSSSQKGSDTRLESSSMRRSISGRKSWRLGRFSGKNKINAWTGVKILEWYYNVSQDEPREHCATALAEGRARTFRRGLSCQLKDREGHYKWWCAACGGQFDRRTPNSALVLQESTDRSDAKMFTPTHSTERCMRKSHERTKLLANRAQKNTSDTMRQ